MNDNAPPNTARDIRAGLYREGTRAAAIGLLVNLALGVTKLTAGFVADSMAILSDAINSLGDSLTSLVVFIALKVAQRPASDEHPYGYMRAEAIAASNVALLVLISAAIIGWQSLQRMTSLHGVPPLWTLWLAGANAGIKEALYQYKRGVGQRTGSTALLANAWDHRSDALCSLAVVVGLAIVRWGGPRYAPADEVAALVVVGAIVWTSINLFRKSAGELMDMQADPLLVDEIRAAAVSVAGVAEIEKLLVRKSGLEFFVDIHIEVNPQMSVADGHQIGHLVKDCLLQQFPSVRDVLVHLEPHNHR